MTIATIGAAPVSVGGGMTPQQVVDRVIAHWRSQFAQVLPDCPDLIVVPEACDRPSGFSAEKLAEYYRVRKNQVRDFFAGVAREHHCYGVYSAHRFDEAGQKHNSSVLIASEHDTVDVNAMTDEFEIELLNHYFTRSLDRRRTALNQSR